ncbi:hypothetical protein Z517_05032 [Fonsecaea pedrosoi CBS 271.37]|uniref:Uncharacterized protein n=1 Tax=Fonsecaea pedrosoi CBS 271.37 TaxID=1442368 RepID=A0A0D2DW68_9EURO|nr:uncharacterized protein Z517_05032 [Fonsecaea pedrosoi CBS 271.37]KIW82006.1 hypothetical protein Z517_05032 [Fonsecaea pedrosoi CBS 271.37]
MDPDVGEKTWQKFFYQHNSLLALLDAHASLLAEMRKFCLDNSATMNLVQERLNTTESLIATFKLSTESLTEVTKREEQVTEDAKVPEPEILDIPIPTSTAGQKAPTPAEPLLDPSGFFAVDTNPTPIEQLYKEKPIVAVKARNGPKRKVSGEQIQPATTSENERMRKRPKHGEDQRDNPVQEEEDDSFLKRVEARSRAKEERKKAKTDKKRKRQSGDSTGSIKGPRTKKRKENNDPKPVTTTPSSAPSKNPQPQKGKRPLPESNNNSTNGRASKKKRRGSKH